ncbi:hypothetical protein PtB15_6B16 [Puccinia triticina]|nr:hypothetical protein PtB15_6B16 [Puccinia triticina]
MPSYKLTYFDTEEFGKIKETLPFGQLPVLTIDEANQVIPQEVAILKYLGRLTGLYPDDPEEAAKVDILICHVDDLYAAVVGCRTPEHPGREMVTKMWVEERIPKMLSYLDRYLATVGTTNFSAGNSLTIADLRIYSAIIFYKSGKFEECPTDLVDKYPHIAQLRQAIESDEKLASWKNP